MLKLIGGITLRRLSIIFALMAASFIFFDWITLDTSSRFNAKLAVNYFADEIYTLPEGSEVSRSELAEAMLAATTPVGLLTLCVKSFNLIASKGLRLVYPEIYAGLAAAGLYVIVLIILLAGQVWKRASGGRSLFLAPAVMSAGLYAAYWYASGLSPAPAQFHPVLSSAGWVCLLMTALSVVCARFAQPPKHGSSGGRKIRRRKSAAGPSPD